MKIIEIAGRPSIAVNNEEADLLLQFDEDTAKLKRSDLTDRQVVIANQLVNKSLLKRVKEDGSTIYKKRIR